MRWELQLPSVALWPLACTSGTVQMLLPKLPVVAGGQTAATVDRTAEPILENTLSAASTPIFVRPSTVRIRRGNSICKQVRKRDRLLIGSCQNGSIFWANNGNHIIRPCKNPSGSRNFRLWCQIWRQRCPNFVLGVRRYFGFSVLTCPTKGAVWGSTSTR